MRSKTWRDDRLIQIQTCTQIDFADAVKEACLARYLGIKFETYVAIEASRYLKVAFVSLN